jgi:hypothetical protein
LGRIEGVKTLATSFKRDGGFQFDQVQRDGMLAIYKKKKPHHSRWSFETIIIQQHNGFVLAGNQIEPAETYPSSATWGQLGWTFTTLDGAQSKFTKLKSKQ